MSNYILKIPSAGVGTPYPDLPAPYHVYPTREYKEQPVFMARAMPTKTGSLRAAGKGVPIGVSCRPSHMYPSYTPELTSEYPRKLSQLPSAGHAQPILPKFSASPYHTYPTNPPKEKEKGAMPPQRDPTSDGGIGPFDPMMTEADTPWTMAYDVFKSEMYGR